MERQQAQQTPPTAPDSPGGSGGTEPKAEELLAMAAQQGGGEMA